MSRVDAFVNYLADIEADTIEQAVDLAYNGRHAVSWRRQGVVEFDAREMVGLDADDQPLEATTRGDFG